MTIETGSSGYVYGTINTKDEESDGNVENKDFDESNLYYYKGEELTRKEKLSKMIKLLVPIIIAAVFLGGIAFVLFHNFGGLYPGPGEEKVRSSGDSASHLTETETSEYTPTSAKPSSSSGSSTPIATKTAGRSCEANPSCADLGLTGVCCPTDEGIQLGCCS